MAIEWHTRINRPFLLREAVDLTYVRLADLLGQPDVPSSHRVVEASASRRRGGPGVPVPAGTLDRLVEPAGHPDDTDFCMEIPEWDAGTLVSVHEFLPGCDDPETGVFAWVTSQRDPFSQALSIAAAVALAECGGGGHVAEPDAATTLNVP